MENKEINKGNKKSGLATAGLVLGIIGLVFSFIPIISYFSIVMGILAFIFGLISVCKKEKIGMSIAGIILGIAAVAVAIVMTVSVASGINDAINDLDNIMSDAASNMNDISGENTDEILKNNVDVTFGKFQYKEGDFIDEYKLPVTVKNKSSEKKSFSIKIEAVDDAGNRIDEDTVFVNDLNAGQKKDTTAFTLTTSEKAKKMKKAKFKVLEVSMY